MLVIARCGASHSVLTYLSKSTLRIKIRCTVKKLETILVLEGKKWSERKKKKWKNEGCTYVDFEEGRTNVNFNIGRTDVAVALTSAAQTSMRTNVDAH